MNATAPARSPPAIYRNATKTITNQDAKANIGIKIMQATPANSATGLRRVSHRIR